MLSLLVTLGKTAWVAAYVTCVNVQRGRIGSSLSNANVAIGRIEGGDGMTPSGPTIWGHYREWLLLEHDPPRAPRTVSAYRYIIWD